MSGPSVLEQACAAGVIPVVVIDDAGRSGPLGLALKAGGLPVAEVTLRTDAAAEAIFALGRDPDLLVGAGSVIRIDQVDLACDAGARFIVTPGLSAAVIGRCRERDVAVIPGVATATEIITALDHGLALLKFFPAAAAGGVAMLRALSAPFRDVRFIPTGGISAANAPDYLSLPSVAAVGGSWMVASELLARGDFDAVTRLSAQAVELAAGARA